jgi:hypothetical protein
MKAHDLLRIRGLLRIVHIPGDCMGVDPCKPIDPKVVDQLKSGGADIRVKGVFENLVVDDGLSILRGLIGFGENFPVTGAFGTSDVNDLKISAMRIGNATSPPAPTGTDTNISVSPATYIIPFVSFFYPTPTSVTMVGVVPQAASALNGVGITEEGAFATNGAMFARVTFPPEVKIPTHAMQFEHSITVSRP